MARADVAVLINYDTNRSLILFADEIFKFSSLSFVLGDGRVTELNLSSILSTDQNERIPPLCEVDRSRL